MAKCDDTDRILEQQSESMQTPQPLTSCRALAQAHSDLIGSSGGRQGVGCSRTTISRIKDAFAEVCKEENANEIRRAVSRTKAEADAAGQRALQKAAAVAQAAILRNNEGAAVAAARQNIALAGSFTLLHIHDEATLRLRTFGDDDTKPTRSTSSMVQQHAVYLYSGERACIDVLTELDGLADKRGEAIATSVDRVLRSVAKIVGDAAQETGARKWFLFHVLVGAGARGIMFLDHAGGACQPPSQSVSGETCAREECEHRLSDCSHRPPTTAAPPGARRPSGPATYRRRHRAAAPRRRRPRSG